MIPLLIEALQGLFDPSWGGSWDTADRHWRARQSVPVIEIGANLHPGIGYIYVAARRSDGAHGATNDDTGDCTVPGRHKVVCPDRRRPVLIPRLKHGLPRDIVRIGGH